MSVRDVLCGAQTNSGNVVVDLRSRDGRPLVTYMNHGSMLDEPLIMACLVPYDIMVRITAH